MQQVNVDLKKFLDAPMSAEDQVGKQLKFNSMKTLSFDFFSYRRENERI